MVTLLAATQYTISTLKQQYCIITGMKAFALWVFVL